MAGVLALGVDPVVGALVGRGGRRGRPAVFVFVVLFLAVAAVVLVTVGPLWNELVAFAPRSLRCRSRR